MNDSGMTPDSVTRSGKDACVSSAGCLDERERRLSRMRDLHQAGRRHSGAFPPAASLSDILARFEEGAVARAAGRLMTIRQMGKSIFADLRDGSGRLQVYACKSDLSEEDFGSFKLLDAGDLIEVEGTLFITRTGEKTVRVVRWSILSKALRPLPEKWHGLKDIEIRFRQRYLDLIANPDSRSVFEKRSLAIREIRMFLWKRGFMEVETPMLQRQSGGAAARPFRTRYESLSADMFLRIAPELYLKKLLVGGFDRIFELNRNFRNEGLSRTHNPEFTMLEIYQAYSDVRSMKELVESLVIHVAGKVCETLRVGDEASPIDLSLPWREAAYRDLVIERMGADWFDLARDAAAARATELGLVIDPDWSKLLITHEVYEKVVERQLVQPTFVTRLPVELVPLARVCEDDPASADVFELVIGGKEIAPAYSELNDASEQRKRLEQQAGADAQKVDEEFLEALEYGMPPAGGMGIGIDRLMMILSGAEAIRDVILFPQLKPKEKTEPSDSC